MGLREWLHRATAPAPSKLVTDVPEVRVKPLWDQFCRIGGNITPAQVSSIVLSADIGQPARFVDLTNESRQKDGHIQSCLSTREQAVALVDLGFVAPKDASRKELKAVDLCKRVRDDFENFADLIEHLVSVLFAHGTATLKWEMTGDGLLLPCSANLLHARDFVFANDSGALRYSRNVGDTVGVDLLAANPGRVIQVQRRIVGDVQAREGLARVLLWSAIIRNWDLKDWVALGEIGWKPWRIGKYSSTDQEEVDKFVRAMELIGSTGVACIPEGAEIAVEWPKGGGSGSGGSVHRELFEALGREISKCVLGQTTSIESGPHGTRGDAQTRDRVRVDIRERDCRVVANALYCHIFRYVVAVNLGNGVRCPVPWFETEESADQVQFSTAIKNLHDAGLRIPAKYVRDEMGMPDPDDDEEMLQEPDDPNAPDVVIDDPADKAA